MTYIAGWNQPGCLPDRDAPLPRFDTFAEAVAYLTNEVNLFWDEDYSSQEDSDVRLAIDGKWLPIHTELHNTSHTYDDGTHTFAASAGGFEWFITPEES